MPISSLSSAGERNKAIVREEMPCYALQTPFGTVEEYEVVDEAAIEIASGYATADVASRVCLALERRSLLMEVHLSSLAVFGRATICEAKTLGRPAQVVCLWNQGAAGCGCLYP